MGLIYLIHDETEQRRYVMENLEAFENADDVDLVVCDEGVAEKCATYIEKVLKLKKTKKHLKAKIKIDYNGRQDLFLCSKTMRFCVPLDFENVDELYKRLEALM